MIEFGCQLACRFRIAEVCAALEFVESVAQRDVQWRKLDLVEYLQVYGIARAANDA